MPTKVVIGAQWGDEGKGKTIDILAGKADVLQHGAYGCSPVKHLVFLGVCQQISQSGGGIDIEYYRRHRYNAEKGSRYLKSQASEYFKSINYL